ncbi:MAG: hypothetical protein FJ291_34405 [Planctomycetes bacterium]|nr:hypothetical protein [Planctomycetota bacterium]
MSSGASGKSWFSVENSGFWVFCFVGFWWSFVLFFGKRKCGRAGGQRRAGGRAAIGRAGSGLFCFEFKEKESSEIYTWRPASSAAS